MNRFKTPLVIITTIQPILLLWIVTIAFFLALSVAAAIARGRSWYDTTKTWLIAWALFSFIGVVMTNILGMTTIFFEALFY